MIQLSRNLCAVPLLFNGSLQRSISWSVCHVSDARTCEVRIRAAQLYLSLHPKFAPFGTLLMTYAATSLTSSALVIGCQR